MPDVEKVINELSKFREELRTCNSTTYVSGAKKLMRMDLIDKTIALLKAQEPVVPIRMNHDENKYRDHYRCPICDDDLTYEQQYCAECGRAVKWE